MMFPSMPVKATSAIMGLSLLLSSKVIAAPAPETHKPVAVAMSSNYTDLAARGDIGARDLPNVYVWPGTNNCSPYGTHYVWESVGNGCLSNVPTFLSFSPTNNPSCTVTAYSYGDCTGTAWPAAANGACDSLSVIQQNGEVYNYEGNSFYVQC
jgi:hypothetical protein